MNEEDQRRPCTGQCLSAGFSEKPSRDPAQLSQPIAAPSENGPQQPWHGENVLAVRHWRKHVLLDPLAVQKHALLVTARAEVARLAGESEQGVVPAGIAVDAREAVGIERTLKSRCAGAGRLRRGQRSACVLAPSLLLELHLHGLDDFRVQPRHDRRGQPHLSDFIRSLSGLSPTNSSYIPLRGGTPYLKRLTASAADLTGLFLSGQK